MPTVGFFFPNVVVPLPSTGKKRIVFVAVGGIANSRMASVADNAGQPVNRLGVVTPRKAELRKNKPAPPANHKKT